MRAIAATATATAVATLALSAATPAQLPRTAFAEPGYTVAMTLEEGGRVVATPRLTMTTSLPASIMVDRPDGYAVRVTLRRAQGEGDRAVTVESELHRRDGDGWTAVAVPAIQVSPGEAGSARYAVGGRAGRLSVTVTPNVATLRPL